MKTPITSLRRTVQIVSFIVLLYAAFLGIEHIKTPLPAVDVGTPRTTLYQRTDILWAAADVPVLEIYPPTTSCRFIAKGGVFKACFLHFISENLTWLTPLKYLLPHILLFILLCFLFSRLWCGWLCPLGFLAELLGMLRRHLGLAYQELPQLLRQGLNKLKYTLLILTILISLTIALPFAKAAGVQDKLFLPFCQVCPARILFPILGGVRPCWLSFDSLISSIFTFLAWLFLFIFFLSFFIRRLWCKLCPLGALISFFNRGGLITKEKTVLRCTRCGICARVCPQQNENVYLEKKNKILNHPDCLWCLRCVDLCPEDSCLEVKVLGKKIFKSGGK